MKRNNKLLLITFILLLLTVISCENVYYSGLAGRVIDSDTSSGIGGVNVYAYTSESDRDRAFSAWSRNGNTDPSCSFRATSDVNGNYSFGKIVWKQANSKFGKDYSISNIYLIFFSEEYGLNKSERISVVSSSSNQSSLTSRLTKVMKESNVTFSFVNEETNNVANDTFDFTYSYNNGYRIITNDVTTTNGVYSLTVTYIGDGTVLTVSNVSNPLNNWSSSSSKEIKVNSPNVNQEKISVIRDNYNIGSSGISGIITYAGPATSVAQYNGATLEAVAGGVTSTTTLLFDTTGWNLNDSSIVYGTIPFSGILNNYESAEAPQITFTVKKGGTALTALQLKGNTWTPGKDSSVSQYNQMSLTGTN